MVRLPDFEEMFEIIEELYEVSKKVLESELTLKLSEAEITKTVVSDETYYISGKVPSQSFIDSSFKITGLNGELIPTRKELTDLKSKEFYLKERLDLLKKMVEVWRTQSANERTAIL